MNSFLAIFKSNRKFYLVLIMPTKKQIAIFLSTNLGLTLFMCYPIYFKSDFNLSELIELVVFVCGLSSVIFLILSALNYFDWASKILK